MALFAGSGLEQRKEKWRGRWRTCSVLEPEPLFINPRASFDSPGSLWSRWNTLDEAEIQDMSHADTRVVREKPLINRTHGYQRGRERVRFMPTVGSPRITQTGKMKLYKPDGHLQKATLNRRSLSVSLFRAPPGVKPTEVILAIFEQRMHRFARPK